MGLEWHEKRRCLHKINLEGSSSSGVYLHVNKVGAISPGPSCISPTRAILLIAEQKNRETRNKPLVHMRGGWLATPLRPLFSFFIIYPSRKKHPRFTVFQLEGCIPTWWKQDEDDDVEAASTHTTFYGSTGPFFHRAAMMEMPKRMCTQYSNLVGKSNATRSLARSLPSSIPHLIGIHIQRCTPKVGRQDKEKWLRIQFAFNIARWISTSHLFHLNLPPTWVINNTTRKHTKTCRGGRGGWGDRRPKFVACAPEPRPSKRFISSLMDPLFFFYFLLYFRPPLYIRLIEIPPHQ